MKFVGFLEERTASIFRVEEHAKHVTRKQKNAEPADESSKRYRTYCRIPSQDAQYQLKGSHLRRLGQIMWRLWWTKFTAHIFF
jgi:hypothetical protein